MLRSINNNITRRIDQYLHRNRTVFLEIFKKRQRKKCFISKHTLYKMGFKFEYYTSSYLNRQGKRYFYIYDFAWMHFNTQEVMIIKRRKRRILYPILFDENKVMKA